jgi:hypothetical protein
MEIWKLIEPISTLDFEYEVSNLGNVRSMNYNRTGKIQNLKIRYSPTGNRCVMLTGKKVYSIAPLVLNAFVGQKPTDSHVPFHKNGDKQDDSLENLEWRHISIQNKENGKTGHKFKEGHSHGLYTRFRTLEDWAK